MSRFDPWVGMIRWSRKWQPTPVFLPGESHGQRSLVGYSPWCLKESDMMSTCAYNSFHFSVALLSRVVCFSDNVNTCHPLDKCCALALFLQIKKLGFRVIKLVADHTSGAKFGPHHLALPHPKYTTLCCGTHVPVSLAHFIQNLGVWSRERSIAKAQSKNRCRVQKIPEPSNHFQARLLAKRVIVA